MSDISRRRATKKYRSRLTERGMARFEVLGRDADRELIRSLARRLAEDCPEADRLRSVVSQGVTGKPPRKGGILEALRRSSAPKPLHPVHSSPVARLICEPVSS